jgi:tetratricopeptide (TPR) repeat protein
MALEMAPAVIHLKEVTTGRTVARLEDPHGDRATWLGFTPDGTRLVAVAHFGGVIHVWDLRAIRAGLKAMSLDWDLPEFPSPAAEDGAGPATIEVVLADRSGPAPTPEQKALQTIERRRRELAANPNSAGTCNNLARAYLMAPEPLRDAKAAVPLAEKAARLAPENPAYRNTLGVAYYRAGRFREAVEALRPNLKRQQDDRLAYDLYVLAMSCHRLGERARARDYHDWAVRWVDAHIRSTQGQRGLGPATLKQLAAFRAEAEEVLGIPRKPD